MKSRYARSSVYIKEDDDEVLDLLDRKSLIKSIIPSVSAKRVNQKKLPKGMKMAADGRLVIEDDEDDGIQSEESEDDY